MASFLTALAMAAAARACARVGEDRRQESRDRRRRRRAARAPSRGAGWRNVDGVWWRAPFRAREAGPPRAIGAARARRGAAFGSAVACAALLAAVAAGSSPAATAGAADGPVAVIGSATISRASFDHWMTVANDAKQASTGKVAPALPVPPGYTACVASLSARPANSGVAAATLAARCAKTYRTLAGEVMNFLIQAVWIEGEANARGSR